MKITFNTKNTLIILFTFLVTLYLTITVISNLLSKYEIVKIAEKKNDNPILKWVVLGQQCSIGLGKLE